MTGAELDTRRRALGLSIDETAELVGVLPKTVNRWLRDEQPIHPDVVDQLDALEDRMRRIVDLAIEQVTEVIADGPVPIARYRTRAAYEASADKVDTPLGAHAMLCAWTGEALAAEGIAAEFYWADAIG